jgi:hypothetical protein
VQFDKRRLSQQDMFDMVHKFYPGRRFDTVHVTSEEILHASKHGSETTSSAAGGHEPDRERHGINFCCWVDDRGVFGPYDDTTLNAGELGATASFPRVHATSHHHLEHIRQLYRRLTHEQPSCTRITNGEPSRSSSGACTSHCAV